MKKLSPKLQQQVDQAIRNKVWEWDPATNEILFGERFKSILGYEDLELPDEINSWHGLVHPDDVAQIQKAYETASKYNAPYQSISRFRHKDGSWRTVLNQGQFINDEDGSLVRMVGVHTDITELVKTQTRLEAFHALAELSPDIVGIANMRGEVTYLNSPALNLGWTLVKEGKTLFPPESVAFFEKTILPELFLKGSWEGEVIFQDMIQQEKFPVHQRSFLITDKNNKPSAIATVAQDLREKRRLEAQIERQRLQMLQHSKMSALGEMASGIAHEINNPLAILMGNITVLRLQLNSENRKVADIEKSMSVMEQTISRIANTIQELRHFSKQESNAPFTKIPIAKLVKDTLLFCQNRYTNNKVSLQVGTIPEGIFVSGHEMQLRQALLHLLNNAFDAVLPLNDERWIKLDCQVLAKDIHLRVIDSGKGISPEHVNKLMEPFFTTKEVGLGSGMGLAVTKGITEMHRGSLSFDREAPQTTFVISLPILF